MYYPAEGTTLPEKREKPEYTAQHQLLSISVASNVPAYEEPQCFVVQEEGRESAPRTVTAFVERLEKITEKASQLELQRFTPILNRMEDTWGLAGSPSPASSASEHESGESTGFDDDETGEDRALINRRRRRARTRRSVLLPWSRPGVGRTGAFAR